MITIDGPSGRLRVKNNYRFYLQFHAEAPLLKEFMHREPGDHITTVLRGFLQPRIFKFPTVMFFFIFCLAGLASTPYVGIFADNPLHSASYKSVAQSFNLSKWKFDILSQ